MPHSKFIEQSLIPNYPSRISVQRFPLTKASTVTKLIRKLDADVFGVALQLSRKEATVEVVAFASQNQVFLLDSRGTSSTRANSSELAAIFSGDEAPLSGFPMARIALDIHRDWGYHTRGVDLSTLITSSTMDPASPCMLVYGLYPDIDQDVIQALWIGRTETDLCLRAWISACVSERCIDLVQGAAKVDTKRLRLAELECLGRSVNNIELLEAQKPQQMKNEFRRVTEVKHELILENARYKSRVRKSGQTSVVMETDDGKIVVGRPVGTNGRQTRIQVFKGTFRGGIKRVHVVGREESTLAERAREKFLFLLLCGEKDLSDSMFIQTIWFPVRSVPRRALNKKARPSKNFPSLNPSQGEVADAMISNTSRLVIAHGPPGTGKTTTISAAVKYWDEHIEPVWTIAQSNVGVKNIAEKFVKEKIDFKLIVSKEFYFEWHEEIYGPVTDFLIRSDKVFKDPVDAERLIGGSMVILCTLSMLSNPFLDACRLFELIPFEHLVIDEASQIDTFEFMHLFHKFNKTLRKVCLFGDPKQLPPFGKEHAPGLRTIFDFKHLEREAYFLDTQYRMPVPLGDFISENVYDSKLRSKHNIEDMSCVMFVDVKKGEEKGGKSWVNLEEVHAVVNLVQHYYQNEKIAIITPYDAQRARLVKHLKAQNLPYDCVYNVDSYQGTYHIAIRKPSTYHSRRT
ncbi:P-loop containing nucleoside triphosphate hydrolase protein [Amylocystis lapponica]|nr:P-loop containing nucleoside triphosphate hydrolase protein [Amylocystis lapponica]